VKAVSLNSVSRKGVQDGPDGFCGGGGLLGALTQRGWLISMVVGGGSW